MGGAEFQRRAGTEGRLFQGVASALLRGVGFEPGLSEPSISSRSATLGVPLTAGTTKRYQVQYREPDPLFCPSGASWNFTNGVDVTW